MPWIQSPPGRPGRRDPAADRRTTASGCTYLSQHSTRQTPGIFWTFAGVLPSGQGRRRHGRARPMAAGRTSGSQRDRLGRGPRVPPPFRCRCAWRPARPLPASPQPLHPRRSVGSQRAVERVLIVLHHRPAGGRERHRHDIEPHAAVLEPMPADALGHELGEHAVAVGETGNVDPGLPGHRDEQVGERRRTLFEQRVSATIDLL